MRSSTCKSMIGSALLCASALGGLMVAALSVASAPVLAKPALSPEQRAAAIVAKMTLEEKASQLLNSSPAIPRLNIPEYQWWSEALHGYAFQPHATNFPEPIGLAASFNAPLLKQVAQAISVEGVEASDAMVTAGAPLALVALSGRPVSTSFAIRAGAEGRRPMARIHS
jgi:hypothetical protein